MCFWLAGKLSGLGVLRCTLPGGAGPPTLPASPVGLGHRGACDQAEPGVLGCPSSCPALAPSPSLMSDRRIYMYFEFIFIASTCEASTRQG